MSSQARPYLFYWMTYSLCTTCLKNVPAKILFKNDKVIYQKNCLEHGIHEEVVSTDIEYFKLCKEYLKPGDMPDKFQTQINHGCPHDCWLCPDHEQHSCLAIFEIIDECNMTCPVCFANSKPGLGNAKSMEQIDKMLETLIASEWEPDLLQLSWWEPTLHPQLMEIVRKIKASPVRHLMLNTNGIRIAEDLDFVKELEKEKKWFEVYLQFDSLNRDTIKHLRGWDYLDVRFKALENLEKAWISTTLVCVIQKNVNDNEIWELIDFATKYKCVRWVTFQPVEYVGRIKDKEIKERITLSEIRNEIIKANNPFGANDMLPLPCHPENICIWYGIKKDWVIQPVTGMIPKEVLLQWAGNTITFERNEEIKKAFYKLYSLDACSEKTTKNLWTMLCCLPKIITQNLDYTNVFRIIIMSFMDKYDFDLWSIKRSCVHFVEPNGKIYPFETFNMFYRDKIKAFNGLKEQFKK